MEGEQPCWASTREKASSVTRPSKGASPRLTLVGLGIELSLGLGLGLGLGLDLGLGLGLGLESPRLTLQGKA